MAQTSRVQIWQRWVCDPRKNPMPPEHEVAVKKSAGGRPRACIAPYLDVSLMGLSKVGTLVPIPEHLRCVPEYSERSGITGIRLFAPGQEEHFISVVLRRQDFAVKPYAVRSQDEWDLNLAFYLAGALKTFPGPLTRKFDPAGTIDLKCFHAKLPFAQPGEEYLEQVPPPSTLISARVFLPRIRSIVSRLIQTRSNWRINPSPIFPPDLLHAFLPRLIIEVKHKLILSGDTPLLRVYAVSQCRNTLTLGEFSLSHVSKPPKSPVYSYSTADQWSNEEVTVISTPPPSPALDILDWKVWLDDPVKEALPASSEIRVSNPREVEIAPWLNVDLTGVADGVDRIERVPYYDAKRGVAGIHLKKPGETKYFLDVALRRFKGRKALSMVPHGLRFADQNVFELAAYFAGIATKPPTGFHYTLPGETLDLKHFDSSLLAANHGEGYLESGHLKARQPMKVRIYSPSTSSFPLPLLRDGNDWVVNNLEAPQRRFAQLCSLTSRKVVTSLTHIVEQQEDQLFLRVLGRDGSFGFPALLAVFTLSAGANQTPHYTPVTLYNWLKGESPRPGFSTLTDVMETDQDTHPHLAMVAGHSLFLPPGTPTHEGWVVASPREDGMLGFGVYGFNSTTARFDQFAGNTLPR